MSEISPIMVNDLQQIIENIAISTNKEGQPIAKNKKEFMIGKLLIRKSDGCYSVIVDKTKAELYTDLYSLDSAFSIARCYKSENFTQINSILAVEKKYAKHFLDMLYHFHSYKHAKKKNDEIKMNIMEDRFYYSRQYVEKYKDKLKSFNRGK